VKQEVSETVTVIETKTESPVVEKIVETLTKVETVEVQVPVDADVIECPVVEEVTEIVTNVETIKIEAPVVHDEKEDVTVICEKETEVVQVEAPKESTVVTTEVVEKTITKPVKSSSKFLLFNDYISIFLNLYILIFAGWSIWGAVKKVAEVATDAVASGA